MRLRCKLLSSISLLFDTLKLNLSTLDIYFFNLEIMLGDLRGSEILKQQSRRRTLLCCSTLCLFSFLLFVLLLTQTFHYRRIHFGNNSNGAL